MGISPLMILFHSMEFVTNRVKEMRTRHKQKMVKGMYLFIALYTKI